MRRALQLMAKPAPRTGLREKSAPSLIAELKCEESGVQSVQCILPDLACACTGHRMSSSEAVRLRRRWSGPER